MMNALLPRRSGRFIGRMAVAPILLAAFAYAVPAAADPRLPDWNQSYLAEADFPTRVLRAVGYCAVEGRRRDVARFLAADPYSPEEWEAIEAVFAEDGPRCAVGNWKLKFRRGPLIRGTLAEQLYVRLRRSPRGAAPLSFDGDFAEWSGRYPSEWGLRSELVGSWVARCLTAKAPRQAHALISYNPGSPGETRLLGALRPLMLECLPEGETLSVQRLTMRAMIAEALYQASEEHRELFRNA